MANVPDLDFKLVPEKQVQAAILNPYDRIGWPNRTKEHINVANRQVREIVSSGINQGKGYPVVAKELKERMDITATKAERIARTEGHRAREMGKMAATQEAADMGVIMRRRWVATLDQNTRDTHGDMDGQEIDVYDEDGNTNEFQSPEGGTAEFPGGFGIASEDINCRCTTIDVIEGFEPKTRRTREDDIINYGTYKQYAEAKGWPLKYSGAEPRVAAFTPLEQKAIIHKNPDDFMRQNIDDLKAAGVKSKREVEEIWKSGHYKNSAKSYKEVPIRDAVRIVEDGLPANIRHGWFREADSAFKPRLERAVITNPELRNAGMNIAHQNYIAETGKKIPFNDFVRSNVRVYRGGNMNFVADDVFVSYSYSREAALKFGKNINTQTVSPGRTLGSFQTTGERELLVPLELLKLQ